MENSIKEVQLCSLKQHDVFCFFFFKSIMSFYINGGNGSSFDI